MKKLIVVIFLCLFCFINNTIYANGSEDLLKLFHLAVENHDLKLVNEVLDALLKSDKAKEYLIEALAKYNNKGKINTALHEAIKDKNLLASVILIHHYSKNVNDQISESFFISQSSGISRLRSPIELALQYDLESVIPYLLIKNADLYKLNNVGFLDEQEDGNCLLLFGYKVEKATCFKTKKLFYKLPINQAGFKYERNFIGEAIVKNRLDVLEIINAFSSKIDWNKECCRLSYHSYTPLQLALATERYEVAQFLIDHGANIE